MSTISTKEQMIASLKTVTTELSVVSIPEDALLHEVVKALEARASFRDTDEDLDENMYAGHIFEDLANEQAQYEDGHMFKMSNKALMQLDALAEMVSQDYVLITKI